ncbi:uncharacterized protein LOC127842490 isoform X2 [Dreissena polymorpha]|uniref:CARD domain-containing protein n=1 Tax=Dreissena polymorpha TaxID=45954 RepID=A0A9D4F1J4_DREPO|nr:uncharacterized protein LOC127842490 isoform X2 [Dreissena polymorpha]KAH3787757.1 hypothetical protein DPMN_165886 [Dreissena polymorpha]
MPEESSQKPEGKKNSEMSDQYQGETLTENYPEVSPAQSPCNGLLPSGSVHRPHRQSIRRGSPSKINQNNNNKLGTTDVAVSPVLQQESRESPGLGDEAADAVEKVKFVKEYAWVKNEMSRPGARSVAGHLYQKKPIMLSRLDYETICHCKWRREAVEKLLKKVLMGSVDLKKAFLAALHKEGEKHIAEKLQTCCVTETEVEVFTKLERSALELCDRPNNNEPPLKLSESDTQTLLFHLYEKNFIDILNDSFLSMFYFSIRDHNKVLNTSMDDENRAKTLINTMKQCPDRIFQDLCKVCVQHEYPEVVQKLERRASRPDCRQRQKRAIIHADNQNDGEGPSSSKTVKLLSSADEHRLVSTLQKSSSDVQHALDEYGFKLETVNNGSIVLQLRPQQPDSFQKLKENCRSGKIKDFIPVVYSREGVPLQEGEYRLKFFIYLLPTATDSLEDKKVMFHLETDPEKSTGTEKKRPVQSHHDNPIEEHMKLLCEELEISKPLLAHLKAEKLVDGNIKDEVDKKKSRVEKIRFVLKELSKHGEKGYSALKDFVKEDNEDLYKELITRDKVKVIDSKLDTMAKVTKHPSTTSENKRAQKEVFYSGTVILLVKKKAAVSKGDNIETDCTTSDIEITCPEIIDPQCFFTESVSKCDSVSNQTGVTMVIEEDWSLVGEKSTSKREILTGKRKLSEKLDTGKKRQLSPDEDVGVEASSRKVKNTDLTKKSDNEDLVTANSGKTKEAKSPEKS